MSISRRGFLRSTSAFAGARVLSMAGATGALFASSEQARSEAVTAVVIAAAAVVSAISSFLKSSGSGGLDPGTQAYLERIVANQLLIAVQINEINAQLKELATLVDMIPAQTVTLDKRVQAKGCYHEAITGEIRLLGSYLSGNLNIGLTDRTSFDSQLNRLRESAATHIALVEEVGQSIDVVVAVDTLRLTLESLTNFARLCRFNEDADKRSLLTAADLIRRAANALDTGDFQPELGTFRNSTANAGTEILRTSARLAKFSEDEYYIIKASEAYYRQLLPTDLDGALRITNIHHQEWESCGGKYYEPSGGRQSSTEAVFRPGMDVSRLWTTECRGKYVEWVTTRYDPMSVVKAVLPTPDGNETYFVLAIDPVIERSGYVTTMKEFNNAQVRGQTLYSAELVLRRTLAGLDKLYPEIEGI